MKIYESKNHWSGIIHSTMFNVINNFCLAIIVTFKKILKFQTADFKILHICFIAY